MKIGVVGLPNVGKSTLFNALTKAGAQSANYPFCTIEPNVGIVTVPDARIDFLSEHYKTKSKVYATIEFVDIAGLVKGAASGEGLGNKFLANIRECDAIAHVVRCFDNGDIIHVDGAVDPLRDIETITIELILADLDSATKQLDRIEKQLKGAKSEKLLAECELLKKIKAMLADGKPASDAIIDEKDALLAKGFFLLTAKPVVYVANVNESDIATDGINNTHFKKVNDLAVKQNNGVVAVSARIEEELANLSNDDAETRAELMEMYGLRMSGLDRLIKASYDLLGLISYLTAGEPEVRAWTITNGTKAPGAAGRLHTDFERGFIKADVVAYDDLVAHGSMIKAKEAGKVRSEGKEYIVKDGDIIHFKFNV